MAPERAKQEAARVAQAQELAAAAEWDRKQAAWKVNSASLAERADDFRKRYHASPQTKDDAIPWSMERRRSYDGIYGSICMISADNGVCVVISSSRTGIFYCFEHEVGDHGMFDDGKWWAGNRETVSQDVLSIEDALKRVYVDYRRGAYA